MPARPTGASPPALHPLTQHAPPGPVLRPYVRAYIEQAFDVPPGQTVRLVQSASTDPVACVTWSGEIHIGLGAGFRLPPLALAGPLPQAFANTFAGAVRGFFVRFAPAGPLALFGVFGADYLRSPAFEDAVPEALRSAVRRWGEAVIRAPDFSTRVALTEAFLTTRLPFVPTHSVLLREAIERIETASGHLRIADLAAALGVGESTLRRRFRTEVGIPAKRLAEVVRFRHTHAFLHTTPNATWADAVVRFGYADQAHLIHQYHRFAGIAPTHWSPTLRFIDLTFGIEETPGV